MPKSFFDKSTQALSGCAGASFRILLVLFFLVVGFMLISIFGLWMGVIPEDFAMLEFLNPAPKSFKEGRKLATEGKYEAAVAKYEQFFREDADEADEDTVVNAHMHLAQIYFELAEGRGPQVGKKWTDSTGYILSEGLPSSPVKLRGPAENAEDRIRWRRLASEHCAKVLRIRPGHDAAVKLRQRIETVEPH